MNDADKRTTALTEQLVAAAAKISSSPRDHSVASGQEARGKGGGAVEEAGAGEGKEVTPGEKADADGGQLQVNESESGESTRAATGRNRSPAKKRKGAAGENVTHIHISAGPPLQRSTRAASVGHAPFSQPPASPTATMTAANAASAARTEHLIHVAALEGEKNRLKKEVERQTSLHHDAVKRAELAEENFAKRDAQVVEFESALATVKARLKEAECVWAAANNLSEGCVAAAALYNEGVQAVDNFVAQMPEWEVLAKAVRESIEPAMQAVVKARNTYEKNVGIVVKRARSLPPA